MNRKTIDPATLKHSASLRFLYETVCGRAVLKLLTQVWISKLVGAFMNTSLSVPLIKPTVKKHGIDMTRFEPCRYHSYNSFFTRQLKQENREPSSGLTSPCDGKLTVYPINDQMELSVKGGTYTLEDILQNQELASEFRGGLCLQFRLTIDDYHRYGYFDDCREETYYDIKGILHTVQPIAFRRHKVYKENSRSVTVLSTAHFGRAVQIEVGATCVGRIQNHHIPGSHSRGEEKGMFLFGGSTVLLLLKQGIIDEEILLNSQKGLETVVRFGEQIGTEESFIVAQ